MGQLLYVAREFARQHAEQLVEHGLGKDELIALFDDAYRLEVAVAYRTGIVSIRWAGTHREYDERNRKR